MEVVVIRRLDRGQRGHDKCSVGCGEVKTLVAELGVASSDRELPNDSGLAAEPVSQRPHIEGCFQACADVGREIQSQREERIRAIALDGKAASFCRIEWRVDEA